MIQYSKLYNPVEKTRDMALTEFTKYIDLRDEQLRDGTTTNPDLVRKIQMEFYRTHSLTKKRQLDNIWATICPMVESNSALAQFIIDYGGARSEYFFPWLITVANSPSAALEMAYGAGYDVEGEWSYTASKDDEINDFVHNVPTFVYNRERQLFMANLVSAVQRNGSEWNPTTVVDLGAGRLAWGRWHNFHFDSDVQKIIAVDKDPSINADELFGPDEPGILGVDYQHADALAWLATLDKEAFDLVMLGGVASYFPFQAFTEAVIKPVYHRLKKGGAFFFDLQLDCPQYEWTIKLFDWPEMKLAKTVTEAINQVEATRKALWRSGIKFGATYTVDTYNEHPSAVMIVMNKL